MRLLTATWIFSSRPGLPSCSIHSIYPKLLEIQKSFDVTISLSQGIACVPGNLSGTHSNTDPCILRDSYAIWRSAVIYLDIRKIIESFFKLGCLARIRCKQNDPLMLNLSTNFSNFIYCPVNSLLAIPNGKPPFGRVNEQFRICVIYMGKDRTLDLTHSYI